jgi:hypothetical protein
MTATIESLVDEYIGRYATRDIEGVTDLCLSPFLAIRQGKAIHLPDREAVRDHFFGAIGGYRLASGVADWKLVELDTRQLGDRSAFITAHWNAIDKEGAVVRDTWTSYQLLMTDDGWRFLSYTNHF